MKKKLFTVTTCEQDRITRDKLYPFLNVLTPISQSIFGGLAYEGELLAKTKKYDFHNQLNYFFLSIERQYVVFHRNNVLIQNVLYFNFKSRYFNLIVRRKKHTMNVIMVYILNLIQKCVLEVRRQIEISKMPMLLISVHGKIGTVSPFRKNEP